MLIISNSGTIYIDLVLYYFISGIHDCLRDVKSNEHDFSLSDFGAANGLFPESYI